MKAKSSGVSSSLDYEVAIIGGGPAGAAAARALARCGRRVLLVERQRFPRFHIGESLLPATNEVFRKLGLSELVVSAGFVEKRGASFTIEDGTRSSHVDFTTCSEVPIPLTYQVLRSRFDQLLLEQAGAAGAELRQGCQVREVVFERERVVLTLVGETAPATTTETVSAEVLLDASGQAGFLAKRFGLRQPDPRLRKVAVYAHFEGVPRPPGERSGDIRIVSRHDLSWFWLIPLSPTVTSVGVVVGLDQHRSRAIGDPRRGPVCVSRFFSPRSPCNASCRSRREATPGHLS